MLICLDLLSVLFVFWCGNTMFSSVDKTHDTLWDFILDVINFNDVLFLYVDITHHTEKPTLRGSLVLYDGSPCLCIL